MTVHATHSSICCYHINQEHLSHLAFPLAWPHGWEALAEAIDAVGAIAARRHESVALGGSGPYDILLHPAGSFALFPNIDQGRGWPDAAMCATLIPLIGNNGCGPNDEAELIAEFAEALRDARELGRPVLIGGHAGLYSPLVKPCGAWLLLPEAALVARQATCPDADHGHAKSSHKDRAQCP